MNDVIGKRQTLIQSQKIQKKKNTKQAIIDIISIILGLSLFIGIVIALSYNI